MKEARIFENWINNLSEGTWALPETPEQRANLEELMGQELIVGPDATNATEQLYDLIGDDQLFDILTDLAERSEGRANIWDDSDVQGRLAELGIQMPNSDEDQPEDANVSGNEVPAQQQGVAEGIPQAGSEVDQRATSKYAEEIKQALIRATSANVQDNHNRDGSIQLVINPTTTNPRVGYITPSGSDGATAKNVSAAINKYYNYFRQKGWRFDQPTQGQFTIAIPTQGMAEGKELYQLLKFAGVPVTESRMLDETGETLTHICDRYRHEVKNFETTGELDSDLFDALFDYYLNIGEMPYGVAKARTGDPYEWVTNRFSQDQGLDESNSGMLMPEADVLGTFESATCNETTQGEYCPEHGLVECGSMYEMGTVAGGMAPVIGEAPQSVINYTESQEGDRALARIKSLALLR